MRNDNRDAKGTRGKTMKKQTSVWVVSTALMLSIGVMASLSNKVNLKAAGVDAASGSAPVVSHRGDTVEAATPPSSAGVASTAPSAGGSAALSGPSLSPNLMHTD